MEKLVASVQGLVVAVERGEGKGEPSGISVFSLVIYDHGYVTMVRWGMAKPERTITAAEFKAKCLKLMDSVEQTRTEVVITKRGKAVARLTPYEEAAPAVFGYMAGTGRILGDILSPLEERWSAEHE